MNLPDVEVDVRDVLGRTIHGCVVDVVEKRGQGGTHYRAEVSSPGYRPAGANLDFNNRGRLVLFMDPEQCECPSAESAQLANLELKMKRTWVGGRSVWSHIEGALIDRADRAWFLCDEDLLEAVQRSEAFKSADESMHHPPEGHEDWTKVGVSVKTREPYCSLQLVFWRDEHGDLIVEVDIDVNNKLLEHLADALIIHPLTGQPDPRMVGQLMVLYCGYAMAFEMRPRERAA